MTVDPSITQVLQDRAIKAARDGERTTAVILSRVAEELPAAHAHVTAQSITAPAQPEVDPDAIAAFINANLPRVIALLTKVRAAGVTFATARLVIAELSGIVATAGTLKGATARAAVLGLFSWAWDAYLAPALPAWLKPFGGLIKGGATAALEALYQAAVKKLQK